MFIHQKKKSIEDNKVFQTNRINFLTKNFQYENFFLSMIKSNFYLIPFLHLSFLVYLIYKSIISIKKKKNLETMFILVFLLSIFTSNLIDVWVTSYLSSIFIWILFFYIYFKVNIKKY